MRHEFPVIENNITSKISAMCKADRAVSWVELVTRYHKSLYSQASQIYSQAVGDSNDSCYDKHDSTKLFSQVCSCHGGKASGMHWHPCIVSFSYSKVQWFHLQRGDTQTRSKYPLYFIVQSTEIQARDLHSEKKRRSRTKFLFKAD